MAGLSEEAKARLRSAKNESARKRRMLKKQHAGTEETESKYSATSSDLVGSVGDSLSSGPSTLASGTQHPTSQPLTATPPPSSSVLTNVRPDVIPGTSSSTLGRPAHSSPPAHDAHLPLNTPARTAPAVQPLPLQASQDLVELASPLQVAPEDPASLEAWIDEMLKS